MRRRSGFPEARCTFLAALLAGGLWCLGQGSWIHAKAVLAQALLEAAWTETLQGAQEVKPWPWADTWPVGRLAVPRLGISRIVLAGANGSALAFGPGHLVASAAPGETGHIVIAGHRDTHFRFLRDVHPGDDLRLQDGTGTTRRYRVFRILVLDERTDALELAEAENLLILITCWPFDALTPGGPLRYVVMAARGEAGRAAHPRYRRRSPAAPGYGQGSSVRISATGLRAPSGISPG